MADPIQEQVDDRIVLKIVGENFTPNGHSVSAYITSKFKEQQCISGHTWGHVDQETKDFYYREFLKRYTWQPSHEENFKATWNLYCQTQYKKLLHKWRKRRTPPQHVLDETWEAWQRVWSGEKWQKNSDTARRNRNSEVAGPGTGVTKHTAGSRSIVEHALKLEETLQRRADCWELFRSTHIKKDGTFVDARSQTIDDDMTARVTAASQPAAEGGEPQIITADIIDNIFFESVGGMKKRCLYGLGSQAKVVFPDSMSTPRGRGRPSSSYSEVQELKVENADLKARVASLEHLMRTVMSRMVLSQPLESPSAFPDFSSPVIDSDETLPPSPPRQ